MLGKQKRALVNKIGASAGQPTNTANTRHRPNVVAMLGQRRRPFYIPVNVLSMQSILLDVPVVRGPPYQTYQRSRVSDILLQTHQRSRVCVGPD